MRNGIYYDKEFDCWAECRFNNSGGEVRFFTAWCGPHGQAFPGEWMVREAGDPSGFTVAVKAADFGSRFEWWPPQSVWYDVATIAG